MEDIQLSIIAPCFNEEGNIELLCERVGQALAPGDLGFELILVDDASTDQTAAAIRAAQERFDFVAGAFHEKNQGIVGGWKTGQAHSRGRFLVTIDADLQYRPEDITLLYDQALQTGADMVQGWRQTQVKRGLMRRALTSGLSVALNLAFGMWLKDNKSGFVLYKRDVMGDVLGQAKKFDHFQHFITIAAHARGYTIKQVPVTFDERNWGESFIQNPIRFSVKVLPEFWIAFVEFRLKRSQKRLEG